MATLTPGQMPFDVIIGLNGHPLNGGRVYIGEPNKDPEAYPLPVFWDADGTIPAAQPLETSGGYVVRAGTPARWWTTGAYSITVRDRQGRQVWHAAEVVLRLPDGSVTDTSLSNDSEDLAAILAKLQFLQSGDGAVFISAEAAIRAFAVTPEQFKSDEATDDTEAFRKAIATGRNVYAPGEAYLVKERLRLIRSGQRIMGRGAYENGGTRLIWGGKGTEKGRMIEFASGREETGNSNATVSGIWFTDFKIEALDGSEATDLIWVEDGVFHSGMERVYFRWLHGEISSSVLRLTSGGGLSYPVHFTTRDVTIRGRANGSGPATARGVWLESGIECLFHNTFVYDCDKNWVVGTPTNSNYRTVSDCTWYHCLSETGDRPPVGAGAVGLHIYGGSNLVFDRWMAKHGVGAASAIDQKAIVFSGNSGACRSITFKEPVFSGNNRAQTAIHFDDTYDGEGVRIIRPDIINWTGDFIARSSNAMPNVEVIDPICDGYNLKAAKFRGRRYAYDPISLNNGETELMTFDNFTVAGSAPILVAFTRSVQGCVFQAFKNTSGDQVRTFLYNGTGATVDLQVGAVRLRKIYDDEVRERFTIAYDPPSITNGASFSTTFPLPGARKGDPVAVGFYTSTSGNMRGLVVSASCMADGVVAVTFQNWTGATLNLSPGELSIVIPTNFDAVGVLDYVPPGTVTIPAGGGRTITVPVTNAALGDHAVVGVDAALSGITMTSFVSDAGVVSVRLQNGTASPYTLTNMRVFAGVYRNYPAM